jgi:TonB family protein
MLPRLYPRPFEKPAPVFQSGASGGRRLSRRIAFLRHRHRQALVAAGICSLAMHAVLGFAVRRYSPLAHPEPVVGYREGIDVIELAPIDPELPVEKESSVARPPHGALLAIEMEATPDPEIARGPELPTAPRSFPREQVAEPAPPIDEGEPTLRIELREDWTVDPSSPEAAYSDQFNPIRLVVPEYPELAVARDIQGLVKLEAEVGANGKVLQVHVLHADDGSLAMSAAHALLLWEFHPFVLQGAPRPFRIVVPFRFRIQDRGEG